MTPILPVLILVESFDDDTGFEVWTIPWEGQAFKVYVMRREETSSLWEYHVDPVDKDGLPTGPDRWLAEKDLSSKEAALQAALLQLDMLATSINRLKDL